MGAPSKVAQVKVPGKISSRRVNRDLLGLSIDVNQNQTGDQKNNLDDYGCNRKKMGS